jgi:hypothetical protein
MLNNLNDYIYAGSYYGGVYRAKLSDFGITDVPEIIPPNDEITIFPNPATNQINICFLMKQITIQ